MRALILSCSLHRTSEHTRELLEHWTELARNERWYELYRIGIEYTCRPRTVARDRPFFPLLLRLLSRPRHPEHMELSFESRLNLAAPHPAPDKPSGARYRGRDDRVVPAYVQRETAALIPQSQLVLYPGYGHSDDQENLDYVRQVNLFVGTL